jgi:hypothetical protein
VVAPEDVDTLRRVGKPLVVGVLGTSMNSGKTTTVASIVRGLSRAGLVVAAGKVTGTGAGGDPMLFKDSGACRVLDFTDFGYGSTYRLAHEQVRSLLVSLIDELAATGPDVIVVEVADGLYQGETGRLVADPLFKAHVDKVVFAAAAAMDVPVLDKEELASARVADLLWPGYAKPVMSRSETSDRAAG